MTFLPAYDQDKQRPVIVLRFFDRIVPSLIANDEHALQYTTQPRALISDERGLVESIPVKDLVILWSLISLMSKADLVSFSTIEKVYKDKERTEND